MLDSFLPSGPSSSLNHQEVSRYLSQTTPPAMQSLPTQFMPPTFQAEQMTENQHADYAFDVDALACQLNGNMAKSMREWFVDDVPRRYISEYVTSLIISRFIAILNRNPELSGNSQLINRLSACTDIDQVLQIFTERRSLANLRASHQAFFDFPLNCYTIPSQATLTGLTRISAFWPNNPITPSTLPSIKLETPTTQRTYSWWTCALLLQIQMLLEVIREEKVIHYPFSFSLPNQGGPLAEHFVRADGSKQAFAVNIDNREITSVFAIFDRAAISKLHAWVGLLLRDRLAALINGTTPICPKNETLVDLMDQVLETLIPIFAQANRVLLSVMLEEQAVYTSYASACHLTVDGVAEQDGLLNQSLFRFTEFTLPNEKVANFAHTLAKDHPTTSEAWDANQSGMCLLSSYLNLNTAVILHQTSSTYQIFSALLAKGLQGACRLYAFHITDQ